MTEQPKPRYVTRAINEELNIDIQVLLWELLESIGKNSQPREEIVIELGGLEIKDAIIWIIDEPDNQMMLFPSDY